MQLVDALAIVIYYYKNDEPRDEELYTEASRIIYNRVQMILDDKRASRAASLQHKLFD